MVRESYVYNIISKLKKGVKAEIEREDYSCALDLVSNCANILYQTNLYYVDEELENDLQIIS